MLILFLVFRDESVRPKITRLVKIWADRKVYDKEFLVNLAGILGTHIFLYLFDNIFLLTNKFRR